MLGLFSIRISDFYTLWLPKCFVVDFANFGEISGSHFAEIRFPAVPLFFYALTLLFPYPALRLLLCGSLSHPNAYMRSPEMIRISLAQRAPR